MNATLPRYGLAPPSEDDALTMLARVIGVDRAAAVWARALREAGFGVAGRTVLGPAELLRVAEVLMRSTGAERAIGNSLAVRSRTWLLLNREQPGAAR